MIWLDNHFSPRLASWIETRCGMPCRGIRDLGLARASDRDVFDLARSRRVLAIVTKDRDFAELSVRIGPPPSILIITTGNTSTAHLQDVFAATLEPALAAIRRGEALVEIGAP